MRVSITIIAILLVICSNAVMGENLYSQVNEFLDKTKYVPYSYGTMDSLKNVIGRCDVFIAELSKIDTSVFSESISVEELYKKITMRRTAYTIALEKAISRAKGTPDSIAIPDTPLKSTMQDSVNQATKFINSYIESKKESVFAQPNASLLKHIFIQNLIQHLAVLTKSKEIYYAHYQTIDNLFMHLKASEMLVLIEQIQCSEVANLVTMINERCGVELISNMVPIDSMGLKTVNQILTKFKGEPEYYYEFLESLSAMGRFADSQSVALQPLREMLQQVNNDQRAAVIFREVAQVLPDTGGIDFGDLFPPDTLKKYVAKEELLRRLEAYKRFDKTLILENGELIKDYDKLKESISKKEVYEFISSSLSKGGYKVHTSNREQATFRLKWKYNLISKNKSGLIFELYDDKEKVSLVFLSDSFLLDGNETEVRDRMNALCTSLVERMTGSLNAYKISEKLKDSPLPDFINIEKYKSYLYAHSYFDLSFKGDVLGSPWLKVDGIAFDVHAFQSGDERISMTDFMNILEKKLKNSFKIISIDSSKNWKRPLIVYGRNFESDSTYYEIRLFTPDKLQNYLSIKLEKAKLYDEEENKLPQQYYAEMITQVISKLIGVNHSFVNAAYDTLLEIELAKFQSKPSLFTPLSSVFAGTPQYLYAAKKANKEIYKKSRIRSGLIFSTLQIVALVVAANYESKAIENSYNQLGNDYLCKRNWCLGAAAIPIVASFSLSWHDRRTWDKD